MEAPNANYKCFVKFLAESYISGALTANPILYLDLLEQFWASAVVEEMALEDATVSYTIFCKLQDKNLTIDDAAMNKALGMHKEEYDALATDEELLEFFEFIRYAHTIKLGDSTGSICARSGALCLPHCSRCSLPGSQALTN